MLDLTNVQGMVATNLGVDAGRHKKPGVLGDREEIQYSGGRPGIPLRLQ